MTRHLLTIIFPSGLTVIIVQTCLGEEPRARPDAPSRALLPPRPGREPAAGRSRIGARSGSARPRRAGEGERRGCRRAARAPGRAVSASPPSPLHILGAGRRRAPRPPAARLPARARSLGGTAPRRADGLPAAGALIPGPAPSVPARGGPGPAPRPPAPPGRADPPPRAAPRPWLRAREPGARPAACSLGCPRPGVRRPARTALRPEAPHCFLGGGGGAAAGAAEERPRRFLGALAPPRGHVPAARSPGPGRGSGDRGAGALRLPPTFQLLGRRFPKHPGATSSVGLRRLGLLLSTKEVGAGRRLPLLPGAKALPLATTAASAAAVGFCTGPFAPTMMSLRSPRPSAGSLWTETAAAPLRLLSSKLACDTGLSTEKQPRSRSAL